MSIDERFVIVVESDVKETPSSINFRRVVAMMSNFERKLIDFCSSRKSLLTSALYCGSIVLCLVYMALSAWHHFGDEDSLTALSVGGVCIVMLAMRLWKQRNSWTVDETKLDRNQGLLKEQIKLIVSFIYKHSTTINMLVKHFLRINYNDLLSIKS
jgi:hypothetical protein